MGFFRDGGVAMIELNYQNKGVGWGGGMIRASLRFDKRLNFSIYPRKLSIFCRSFSDRSEALGMIELRSLLIFH